MYSGRLGNVRRQEDSHRKFMCVMNEMARNRHDLTKNYIKKELHYNTQRQDRTAVLYKRDHVQRKILLKCMELRREDTLVSQNKNLYGHYGGRPMHAFSKDIDLFLEETDPKKQKQRRINDIMRTSHEKGMVLGSAKMKERVRGFLSEKCGVKYPEKTTDAKPKEEAATFKKKDDDEMPTITISALFKPSLALNRKKVPGLELFDSETNAQPESMSVEDARRLLYPGDDRHKNCKRCYHVHKVPHFPKIIDRTPREMEPRHVLERNLLVFPEIHRRGNITI